MSKLNILQYPDSRLRTVAQPVKVVDDRIRALADDMLETMYDAPGIGLAATQVDVHERVVVIDVSDERNEPRVLINPEILKAEGTERSQEGCLSVPGYQDTVERAEWLHVRALDRHGASFEFEAHGLLAICVQHEVDHLNGKLFLDHLSELKRKRAHRKLTKQSRLTA
ncbi:peptide deformylase [Aquisalimonas sp.]|uniref:peptide deformylase n=1 Tax=Aquisalimonas sp. TaxID=1872621 RepID=UPI0025C2D3D4|nr:peptide deformylase [Aquisalimonas sp.]